MTKTSPLSGWLLERTVAIDAAAPGFAGHVLRSSAERRHAIAAYLSVARSVDDRSEMAAKAAFLARARHNEMIAAAFGDCPSGMRGALRRAGHDIHAARFYRYLYGLLNSASRPEMAGLLRALNRIDPPSLAMIRALPTDLRSPNLVSALVDLRRARDLVRLVNLLTAHGGERRAMVKALLQVRSPEEVRSFAKRWALKIELPPHPVPSSSSYRPIERSDDIGKLALSYRNCMRNYLSNVLERRSAFAEFVTLHGRAIVHLVNADGEWRLDRIYGVGNSRPPADLAEAARLHLSNNGVRQRDRRSHAEGKWEPLRRLAGHFDFDVDD